MTMVGFTAERDAVRADLGASDAVGRLYAADHTLWSDDPTELSDRVGWIPVVAEMLADLTALAARCDALVDDIDDVIVMGMGGSSLFPEVLARTLEPAPGRPRLHVLDTTDPAAIQRIADTCPPDRTLHLASSKSGSTIETRSHLEWAWERAAGAGRFAVVTDPGSELGRLARERGFAEVFENRGDIGGRYSALSLFGIVPGLLMGADVVALLRGGLDALVHSGPEAPLDENPALLLAGTIARVGEAAHASGHALGDRVYALSPHAEYVAAATDDDGERVRPLPPELPWEWAPFQGLACGAIDSGPGHRTHGSSAALSDPRPPHRRGLTGFASALDRAFTRAGLPYAVIFAVHPFFPGQAKRHGRGTAERDGCDRAG